MTAPIIAKPITTDAVASAAPPRSAAALWTACALFALTLVVYHRLAYDAGVPGGYDTQTYFFPYRKAVADALRAGQLPLWDPQLFLGAPLFANIQAAVLYPPNILYLFMSTPHAIAASLILHVWWAAWGMALLCRVTYAVPWPAAALGGAMFGLSGFFGAQAGHVNQVDAAAWLPWLLLAFDAAWQRRSAGLAVLCALIVALQFLAGHTQESYFILVVACAWGLWRMLQRRRDAAALRAIVAVGIVALAGGIALAAVQLFPTFELTTQSIRRTGLTAGEAGSFSLRPDRLAIELLPGWATQPETSEHVAYVGVLGLLLAIVGAVRGWRRPGVLLLYLLAIVPFLLAFGVYDPLWLAAFHVVPGFSSFRVPARWLYVTTFALAALGAIGSAAMWDAAVQKRSRGVVATLIAVVVAALIPAALLALGRLHLPAPAASGFLAIAGLCWLALAATSAAARVARPLLLLAATFELVVAASWLDLNKPIPEQVYADERQTVSFLQGHPDYGRVLSIAQDAYDPGDAATIRLMAELTTGADRAYDTLVSTKFQEIITPNIALAYGLESVDGYDGGILPLASYVALKRVFVPPCGICANPDAILREELTAMPPVRWLQLLGVGAVVDDRIQEFHQDGVGYDLATRLDVAPGATAIVDHFTSAPGNSVNVLTDVAGASPGTGSPVAVVTVTDTAGRVTTATLTEGVNTAALTASPPLQPAAALRDAPAGHATLAVLPLPERRWIKSVTFQSLLPAGTLEVRSLVLRDTLSGSEAIVPLSTDGSISLAYQGDDDIFHIEGAAFPAFLALQSQTAPNDAQAAARLKDASFPLMQGVVLSYPDVGPPLSLPARALRRLEEIVQGDAHPVPPPPAASATTGTVAIQTSGTRLQFTVNSDGPAYLVVKRAWYPGWWATVDGHRVPIYRADLALQAIPVPAGTHTVVVDYRPGSLLVGAGVTVGGVLCLLIVLAYGRRRRRHA